MANMPKRRKSKENPYVLDYNEERKIYIIKFKDTRNNMQIVEVTEDIYNVFDKSELEDISQMHEYERHIEHSELCDITLNRRAKNISITIEEEVEKKIFNEELKEVINELPEIQKRRLKKYYFEDMTYEEIASEENCTKRAVKFSIDIAIEKISKKIHF